MRNACDNIYEFAPLKTRGKNLESMNISEHYEFVRQPDGQLTFDCMLLNYCNFDETL